MFPTCRLALVGETETTGGAASVTVACPNDEAATTEVARIVIVLDAGIAIGAV